MAINTSEMIKKIKEKGECGCPLCGKGILFADKDIPVEHQTSFECSYCKEKLIINIKMK